MIMDIPEKVLKMVDEWARESNRNRPERLWSAAEIIEKIISCKEKCDWELWRCKTKKLSRIKETEDRHPNDPTPEQIAELCKEIRARRSEKQNLESVNKARNGIREFGHSPSGGYVRK
jgi:hypothetical protein